VAEISDGRKYPMRIRSRCRLFPLFAVDTLEPEFSNGCLYSMRRLEWFIYNRPDLIGNVACMRTRVWHNEGCFRL